MLVLSRRAGNEGQKGTTVYVGRTMRVRVRGIGARGVDLVTKVGNRVAVSHVPFGESIEPVPGVVVRPLRKTRGQVRLGFEAPPEVAIVRDNVRKWERRAA